MDFGLVEDLTIIASPINEMPTLERVGDVNHISDVCTPLHHAVNIQTFELSL